MWKRVYLTRLPLYLNVNEFYHEKFCHRWCYAFINIVRLKEDRKLLLLSSWWNVEHVFNPVFGVSDITICWASSPRKIMYWQWTIKWHNFKFGQYKNNILNFPGIWNSQRSFFNLTLLGRFIMVWMSSDGTRHACSLVFSVVISPKLFLLATEFKFCESC